MASLFDKLRNLMSGNVIVRRSGEGKGLKVADVNNFQAFGNVQTNFLDYRGMNTMGGYHSTVGALRNAELSTFGIQRPMLFRDYELMEMDPIIGAALDIVADEMTVKDEFGDVLTIKTEDDEIKKILNNLFVDILNIDFNLWPWVRSLLKYGDFYLKLDIAEKYGVVNVYPLPVYEVLREEGWDPNDPNAVRFTLNGTLRNTSQYYEDYEVAHFRLLADSNFLPYGKSYIETVRRVWKQLCLHEDTKIWLPDGSYKLIKNIKEGDSVISFDYNTNSFKETVVKKAMKTGHEMTYEVSTAHRKIRATADHMLMVSDGTYKRVDELTINDKIIYVDYIDRTKLEIPDFKLDDSRYYGNFTDEFFSKIEYKNICNICGKEQGRLTGNHLKSHGFTFDEYVKKYNYSSKKSALYKYNIKVPYTELLEICKSDNIELANTTKNLAYSSAKAIDYSILNANIAKFIRFWGFMLGDGWLDKSNKSVAFSLGNRRDKSDKYLELLDTLNISYYINKNVEFNKQSCVVSSFELYEIFEKYGFKTGTMKKEVPGWVYHLPSELQIEFIHGFNDADGCHVQNGISMGTINRNLISELKFIAESNGLIVSNIHRWIPKLDKSPMYNIVIRDSNKFLSFNNGVKVEKIRSIKESEIVDVYDFEVDDDLHNFIADGVVSSNCLLEDAALIHRILRAPEKRIFKIDVGNTHPKDIPQAIQMVASKMKKIPYIDPRTGDYNLKFNIQNITEDLYLPVSGGDTGTSVETLSGLQWDSIVDIEYFQNKLLSGLKIPKAYLGYVNVEGGSGDGKSIAAQDVRFARTIERFQRCVVSELTKIAIIHLYSQGITDERMVNFELGLTMPSTIYEQEKIALWQEKINLARDAKDLKMFSMEWAYKNWFNLSENEILEMQKQIVEDTKTNFRLSQIENEGNDPFKTHMTFGTPHDLAMLQKGKLSDTDGALGLIGKKTRGPEKDENDNIDFGDNNFRMNLTGNDNITDKDDYDIEYNKNKRQEPRSKYGQDSHIRGRDPLNKKSLNNTRNMSKLQKIRDSFEANKTKKIVTESLKHDNIEEDDIDDDLFLSEDNKINE